MKLLYIAVFVTFIYWVNAQRKDPVIKSELSRQSPINILRTTTEAVYYCHVGLYRCVERNRPCRRQCRREKDDRKNLQDN